MKRRGRTGKTRSERGALAYVLVIVVLLSCLSIAALAVDSAHGVLTRAQLQSTCDAAALAGAQDLVGASGPLTATQISTAETDDIGVGNLNYTDGQLSAVIVDKPPPMYNPPPYSTSNPQYTVTATASSEMNNIFARLFGQNSEPIQATSRAGVFPTSTMSTAYGSLGQITAPIVVALDVNANNNIDQGIALDQVLKGQDWEIRIDGATAGGDANASWVELQQHHSSSPVSPLVSDQALSNQFAAQSSPGIITNPDGTSDAFVSGGGNNSSTSGNSGWSRYIYNQIVANGGSFNITVPLITDPNGNSDANTLAQGHELQIVGIATFNITKTSHGPGANLVGDAAFYGTLVNAMPLNSTFMTQFGSFFTQFQSGNSSGSGSSSQGTPQVRLY